MKYFYVALPIILLSFFIGNGTIFAYSGEIIPIKLSLNPAPVSKLTHPVVHKPQRSDIQKAQNTPSDDYVLIKAGKSIEVYESSIDKIYVQRINISSGLIITPFFEFHSYDESTGEPLYTQFQVKEKINTLSEKPFSFINGQFFNPKRQNTPLSFGLKTKNLILTAGAEDRDRKKNIFSLSASGAKIIPYSWENFRDDQAEFSIVNLNMESYDSKETFVGRTYICILKPDSNGYSQTILTFSFIAATESFARYILQSWGCQDEYTSKLDSSGSSQFGIGEDIYYGYTKKGSPDYRKLPNIIGFYEK